MGDTAPSLSERPTVNATDDSRAYYKHAHEITLM